MDNSNLINLKVLDLENILSNLYQRYNGNKIYTKINQIIIAMNPFTKVDLDENEPHPDNLSIDCYNDMIKQNTNHSILVSGESGAGKTETTKILLKKLLSLSSKNTKLLEQIYWSNFILESFGNAKTIRNHNSSRFGKFINIYFKDGEIVSAKIEKYLLEKIRVTNKNIDERNFHIFYQLFPELSNYKFIKSNNLTDKNLNDKEDFQNLKKAFDYFNISDEIFSQIKDIIHAIILFSDFQNNTKTISELLQVDEQLLIKSINFKTLKIGSEIIIKDISPIDISIKIDTLCNDLYSKLFDYLVDIINNELSSNVIVDNNINSISLLDIFGFEILLQNNIEQLCINYTNEILQNTFNKYFFEKEQELYVSEGLPYNLVKFNNNDIIIQNIENKVFKIINETTQFINAKPYQIIDKLFKIQDETINISKLQKSRLLFNINHYADSVEYDTQYLLDKNKLDLPDDIVLLLNSSQNNIIQKLVFTKSKDTLLTSFKKQINLLKNKINETKVNFIRCIKPNDLMKPLFLDSDRTTEQLKYNGIEEAIRVARQGYPIRINNDIFQKLYFMIPIDKLDFIIKGKNITFLTKDNENKLNYMKEEIKNNMCIKIQSFVRMYLAKKSYHSTINKIIKIQSIFRMFIQYNKYQQYIKNNRATIIQKYWKGYKQYKTFNKIKFIVKWITFRRIQQLKYRKLVLLKVLILQKNIRLFNLKNKIYKLIKYKNLLKGFIKIIQAKKIRKQLRKDAKDIDKMKVKLKELEDFKKLNDKLEQDKHLQFIKIEDEKKAEKERFLMYQEEMTMKQYLQEYNNKLLLEQARQKQLLLEQERLKAENERKQLEDENNQLIKQFVEKDIENINRMVQMEAQLAKMKRELEYRNEQPPSCIIS